MPLEPPTELWRHLSFLLRSLPPPRLVLHAATYYRPQSYAGWGGTRPLSGGSPPKGVTWPTVAHLQKGRETYNDALSRLGGLLGPLLLMVPLDLTAALRRELDDHTEVRVGWKAVADSVLLALLDRGGATGHQWDALMPDSDGHHTYVSAAPSVPARVSDNLIAAFNDHGVRRTDTQRM